MSKQKISAIVVVEGKSDTQRLQQYYDVHTVETNGLGLNADTIAELQQLACQYELIILTDPDGPGERIRNKLITFLPTAQHIILNKANTRQKHGQRLGVEYADKESLDEAFKHYLQTPVTKSAQEVYTWSDMIAYQFVGVTDAKRRRDYVAEVLHLGKVNAKQFQKRLNFFQVDRTKLEETLGAYND